MMEKVNVIIILIWSYCIGNIFEKHITNVSTGSKNIRPTWLLVSLLVRFTEKVLMILTYKLRLTKFDI